MLKDLSDPDNGVYSLSDSLGDRLSYVQWQMKNILSDPVMKVSMLGKGASFICACQTGLLSNTVACSRDTVFLSGYLCSVQLIAVHALSSWQLFPSQIGAPCSCMFLLTPYV